MSDEDRDVDIESEDEFLEAEAKNLDLGAQPQTQADKRAHHNALERKRRDHIKDSFTGLRDSIPALNNEKVASRAQILKKAADYIQVMRKKNSGHQQEIDELKRQNNTLESQIKQLEKNKGFDGSGTETSDSETSHSSRRKRMKVNPLTSSSET